MDSAERAEPAASNECRQLSEIERISFGLTQFLEAG
jgi:hypothetical protein